MPATCARSISARGLQLRAQPSRSADSSFAQPVVAALKLAMLFSAFADAPRSRKSKQNPRLSNPNRRFQPIRRQSRQSTLHRSSPFPASPNVRLPRVYFTSLFQSISCCLLRGPVPSSLLTSSLPLHTPMPPGRLGVSGPCTIFSCAMVVFPCPWPGIVSRRSRIRHCPRTDHSSFQNMRRSTHGR